MQRTAHKREIRMDHTYTIETLKDGQWVPVKSGLAATLATFGRVLAEMVTPGSRWRAVRDDGFTVHVGAPHA